MIRAGLVLAAGHSRRFGPENKLLRLYKGLEIAAHVAHTFRKIDLEHRIAVVADDRVAALFTGFHILRLDRPDGQQSDSLRAGVDNVARLGAERLLIGLADMPLVTGQTLSSILDHCAETTPACARGDGGPMPPACFSGAHFPALMALTGDRGAGALLRAVPLSSQILVAPEELRDVDRPTDLTALDQVEDRD